MQVSVKTTSALGRTLHVSVPEDRLSDQVRTRLQRMTGNTRVQGFRKGKVPFSIIQQRFGKQVRDEVVNDMLQESMQSALAQENLVPVDQVKLLGVKAEPGTGLSFSIGFDVHPEIKLDGLDGIAIEMPQVDITEDDVRVATEKLRDRYRKLSPVDRAAARDDVLLLNMRTDPRQIPPIGRPARDGVWVELGGEHTPEEFTQHLVGQSVGDKLDFSITFPSDYFQTALRGRTVRFDVGVRQVATKALPELDEEFFVHCGVAEGGLPAFHKEVRQSLVREAHAAKRRYLKRQVNDALRRHGPKELPEGLLAKRQKMLSQEIQAGLGPKLEPDMVREQARHKLSLELIYLHVRDAQQMSPEPERVRGHIESLAQHYQDSAAKAKALYADKQALAQVELACLEEQVVDWLAQQMRAKPISCTLDELLKKEHATG